jgi:hypothetical protein
MNKDININISNAYISNITRVMVIFSVGRNVQIEDSSTYFLSQMFLAAENLP